MVLNILTQCPFIPFPGQWQPIVRELLARQNQTIAAAQQLLHNKDVCEKQVCCPYDPNTMHL